MLCILSPNNDIYFNLAAEEYFLKNKSQNICMIWHSEETVVVGKHQNAMAEVNYLWTLEHNIPVARRLTGGGTVFHGPGNLNFTFIQNGEPGKLVNFERFVRPVVDYIKSLGIPAEIGKRNDILVKNLKISGNAEHVYKNRVLHHGTLLFEADLDKLKNSLLVVKSRYRDKAVQSVRSPVANINSFLNSEMTYLQFTSGLFDYLKQYFETPNTYELTVQEIAEIDALRNEKYYTMDWIYGYSPPFEYSHSFQWEAIPVKLTIKIIKGCIHYIQVESSENNELWQKLEDLLQGCAYRIPDVQERLSQIVTDKNDNRQLARSFFS